MTTDDKPTADAEASELAARRRFALRSRAQLAGDYTLETQIAFRVQGDGTPRDGGLTSEGERYADSLIAAFTDDPKGAVPAATMGEVKVEMRDARRRIAMRHYVASDGEPFTDEECAAFGVLGSGHLAEGGLTDLGKHFADQVTELLDEKFGTSGMSVALGQSTDPQASAVAAFIDSLGIRTPFRHALRDMARSLAEHLDHDRPEVEIRPESFDSARRHLNRIRAEGGEPRVGVKFVGGESDIPAEHMDALHKVISDMFGGAQVTDLDESKSGGVGGHGVGSHEPGDVAAGTAEFPAPGPVPDDAASGVPGRSVFTSPLETSPDWHRTSPASDSNPPSAPDSGTSGVSDSPAVSGTE